MGKASKWFRALLNLKQKQPQQNTSSKDKDRPNRRWSFVKSYREKDTAVPTTKHSTTAPSSAFYGREVVTNVATKTTNQNEAVVADNEDHNKRAIAVAAATAAVAEAAVAAAQAAAAVVRLTSGGRANGVGAQEELQLQVTSAVKIQSAFRGYLARRALRALRGLVRLQALVRGHIERKRTTEWLRRMQALLRAQARARAGRAQMSESSQSSSKGSHSHHPGPPTPEKFEHRIPSKSVNYDQSAMLKRNGSKSRGRVASDQDKAHSGWNWSDQQMDELSWDQRVPSARTGPLDDERSDKILEIDPGKPHFTSKHRNIFHSSHLPLVSDQYSHSYATSKDSTAHKTNLSPFSGERHFVDPLKFSEEVDESPFCTADNSPQFYSASSKGGSSKRSPFTPTKSDGSRSFQSGYSDHPNYMAYTESSRAKVRSISAPKQRPQYDRSSSTKRNSIHGFGESRSSAQRISALHADFTSKAYPGSGRLDRMGMPVGYRY